MDLVFQALRGMAIGLPGVFIVLGIFYVVLKFLMLKTNKKNDTPDPDA